jgi:hypothetical protein
VIRLDYKNLPTDRKKLRRRFYHDYLVMLGGMALTRPNDFLAGTRTVDQFCRWSDISLEEMEPLNYEPFTNLLWELEAGNPSGQKENGRGQTEAVRQPTNRRGDLG